MIVTPNLIPVRHGGQRFLPGEEIQMSRKEYERIAKHLEVID
ncbi:hypothetical protein [Paenibacillus chitinolyticus]